MGLVLASQQLPQRFRHAIVARPLLFWEDAHCDAVASYGCNTQLSSHRFYTLLPANVC
jgi:hypothetical protein